MPPDTTSAKLPPDRMGSAPRDLAEAKTGGEEFRCASRMPRGLAGAFLQPDVGRRSEMFPKLLLNRPKRSWPSREQFTQPPEPKAAGEHLS